MKEKSELLEINLVKAEAVMDFCKEIANAVDSGFMDDGFNIDDIYQMGRDHAAGNYDVKHPTLNEWRAIDAITV